MKEKTMFISKEISLLTVALYSVDQDCYHIEHLHQYIHTNVVHSLIGSTQAGYKMIGIFKSDVEADTYIEIFKALMFQSKNKKP